MGGRGVDIDVSKGYKAAHDGGVSHFGNTGREFQNRTA